ncbi:MAG TPA: DUF4177 domain-containing protein [Rhodanobacteraceae bacterium]|nr:DUF4177 domain-containing protein [Rhodanobacteraceae bacterium]
MDTRWEYKVLSLKSEHGIKAAFGASADDKEATEIINREGSQGWELVSAVSTYATQPLRLFFKRPR